LGEILGKIWSWANFHKKFLVTVLLYNSTTTPGWPQSIVRQLLDLGANIGVRNWRDEIPLSRISAKTMADFLVPAPQISFFSVADDVAKRNGVSCVAIISAYRRQR
jgi:hypothetical protein